MDFNTRRNDKPGFDRDREQYIPLDRDAWLRDHDIRKRARRNGEQNHPPTDQSEIDEVHSEILAAINERGRRCKNIVSNHFSDIVQDMNATLEEENQIILQQRIAETANDTCMAIKEQANCFFLMKQTAKNLHAA